MEWCRGLSALGKTFWTKKSFMSHDLSAEIAIAVLWKEDWRWRAVIRAYSQQSASKTYCTEVCK